MHRKNTACFLKAVSEELVFYIYKCQQYTVLNENDKIDKFNTLKEQRWLWVSISIDWSIKSITFKFELSIVIDLSNGFPISVFIDWTSHGIQVNLKISSRGFATHFAWRLRAENVPRAQESRQLRRLGSQL